jgi:hypothetical protein
VQVRVVPVDVGQQLTAVERLDTHERALLNGDLGRPGDVFEAEVAFLRH